MEMKNRGIGKYTRFGIWINVTVMIAVSVAILIVVNMLARTPGLWGRYDLTSQAQNSLSPQTIKILESLPSDVTIYTFLRADPPYSEIIEKLDLDLWRLLKQYKYYSKGKLTHAQYRVDREYGAAKTKLLELEIKNDNNIVVIRSGEGKDARMKVLNLIPEIALVTAPQKTIGGERPPRLDLFKGEEALNGAILAVTDEKKPRIGFLVSHGELSVHEQAGRDGIYFFADSLYKYGYEPVEIDLRNNPDAIKSVAALCVIGPRNSLNQEELKLLRAYLENGGRLLLALGPVLDPQQETNFVQLLADWGLAARIGVVREPVGDQVGIMECAFLQVLDGLSPLHPITRDLRRMGIRLLVHDARGFEPNGKGAEGVTIIDLATTSLRAWDDRIGGRTCFPDVGLESVGRRVVALALEKESKDNKPRMRAVLLGTPNLAINDYISDTRDFMVNAVSWLADREHLVSVAPKPPNQRFLTWTDGKEKFFFYSCFFGVPGLAVFLGLLVWWFRRS